MSSLSSLHLAIEVATQRRDLANRQLAQAQRNHGFALTQLEQLRGYAGEVAAKWSTGAQSRTTPELLHHHYQFMDRLQYAVQLQDGNVADFERRAQLAAQAAQQAEFRLAALRQVLQKRQTELARAQDRREQRQTDEFASALHHRQRAEARRQGETA